MHWVKDDTRCAIRLLVWSRIATLIAAVCLFAGLAIAWQATLQKLAAATPPKQAAIVSGAGVAPTCGVVSSAEDGSLTFALADSSAAPLPAAVTVALVEECP
jgi:hypothetical protein